MLKFEWNALRTLDKVLVHAPGRVELALTPGVVALIYTHKAVNGVGVLITAPGGERKVLWPSYLAVHRDPRDPTEPCWRCQALVEAPERRPDPLPRPSPVGHGLDGPA